jgi:exonuclease III
MKIATFNINNVNKRLPNLVQWLKSAKPDIVCLQELKSAGKDFPAAALRRAGYDGVWLGQKTWNGVAILSRLGEPIVTQTALPGAEDDAQAHYMRNRFARDPGLRLDHLLLSPALAKRLEAAGVDRAVHGMEGASDHAPVWVGLT